MVLTLEGKMLGSYILAGLEAIGKDPFSSRISHARDCPEVPLIRMSPLPSRKELLKS